MSLQATIKHIVKRLDKLSPRPQFYPLAMTHDEQLVFDETISKSQHYLEFGMGGSTLRALQKSHAHIYSVESSSEWISQMREYALFRHAENRRLHIFAVNIGPTQDWGFPLPDNDRTLFEAYSSAVFESIDAQAIDVALVDGRFRVACALQIISRCYENKKLKILIHDFVDRPEYHILLKHLDIKTMADRIILANIKRTVDIECLIQQYEAYKHNPQ